MTKAFMRRCCGGGPRAKRRVAPAASRVDISPDHEVDNLAMAMSLIASTRDRALSIQLRAETSNLRP
jgi:hypothetical protein